MKMLLVSIAFSVPAFAAIAPTPTPTLKVVEIPAASSDLRARCQTAGEWKRYGSIDTCEDEKRQDELIAFQQARLAAEKSTELSSDERTLKDLGFDLKAEAKNGLPASEETDL